MKNNIIAAIHQPNFFPWLGFFDKIVRSDIFVILDHVTNRPNDAIWTKRVQIICNQNPYWLTIPLKKSKESEFIPINQMQINSEEKFYQKHLRTIQQNYGKSPHFEEVIYLLNFFYNHDSDFIADRNIAFITKVCEVLEIKRTFVKSSDLDCQQASTELLAEICRKVRATSYLYGKGASNYQNNEILERKGIKPVAQNFIHPVYHQFNSSTVVPGVSIIDALMNCGIEGTKNLIVKNIPTSATRI